MFLNSVGKHVVSPVSAPPLVNDQSAAAAVRRQGPDIGEHSPLVVLENVISL